MANLAVALLVAVPLQQMPTGTGLTSPAGGDTTGYWQQRVEYTIAATLDEQGQRVRARGQMKYVNNSPDTLREMYVHQYLNAFRPYSRWSEADELAGVVRFQNLTDPDFGYERFTAPVRVDGQRVAVEYPGAPDSTVARFLLPAPLPPGDSVLVAFEWEARPSIPPRRQGRRGRHWDLAQWYPKVAVYDRGGWEHNALRPAGEFYGEFGTYDVTLVVRADQVLGAVGVPVSGDPGWSRVNRGAAPVHPASNAYPDLPPPMRVDVPDGFKVVRFFARDVHHFAWSAFPEYRYEGATYVRPVRDTRWRTWDTVAVHVLYQPGDDSTWGGGAVVQRTRNAMGWLELLFGPYPYPQMTVLHRIEGGGTEFPMLQMNGSPSQGLILHEGGHVWTYGILANNEWRSGWIDEGFTSYQTEWAQGLTPQERVRQGIVDRFREPTGYRGLGTSMAMPRADAIALQRALTDIEGDAQPIGTTAHEFRDFGTYNSMIYSRAQVMFSQLRDELGDSLFVEFLRDYYQRWALRHVDERAMRASAERVSGRDLGWFFRQWVHETGVMDYALRSVRRSVTDSGWVTEATVRRRGEYRHSVPVGVRTRSGWTIGRASDPLAAAQTVRIVTGQEPLEVRLDPHHFTWDWDRRNDAADGGPKIGVDWPLLAQADRDRSLLLFLPMAWYSDPGGANVGMRSRASYLGTLDQIEAGVAAPLKGDLPEKTQAWLRTTNPYFGFMRRPWYGFSAGAALLDDVVKADLGWARERAVANRTLTDAWTLTYANTVSDGGLLPEFWGRGWLVDLSGRARLVTHKSNGGHRFANVSVVGGYAGAGFAKGELALGDMYALPKAMTLGLRAYGGAVTRDAPPQRALHLGARDAVSTFENHWWRPRGSILKQPGVNFLPLGGGALRGFDWLAVTRGLVAVNAELSRPIASRRSASHQMEIRLAAFTDAGYSETYVGGDNGFLTDAGIGLVVRGRFFDRGFTVRLDSPFYVSDPDVAIDRGRAGRDDVAPRWVVSFSDIW